MVGMLYPPSATARIIVTLRAYFDESGTHWGGPMACDVFVLCGYLGTEDLWDNGRPDSFYAKWNDVMHCKPFHAKEMESNPQGPAVKLALANLVRTSGVIGVGGAIHIPSYNRHLLPLIKKRKEKNNPYFFLFADVIAQAAMSSKIFLREDQNEPIGFVFANTELWAEETHKFYDMLKVDEETPDDVRRRMGAVAFEDMEKFVPLQAADHLAFESYHYRNDPRGTHRPVMNLLMDWDQNYGNYYDEPSILKYIDRMKKEGIF
jgi:hypothetical protein